MVNIKQHSRGEWATESPSLDHIKIGSLQRIADATELMARNYVDMQISLDYWKQRAISAEQEIERLKHSRAGYMAALTKLRNENANRQPRLRVRQIDVWKWC